MRDRAFDALVDLQLVARHLEDADELLADIHFVSHHLALVHVVLYLTRLFVLGQCDGSKNASPPLRSMMVALLAGFFSIAFLLALALGLASSACTHRRITVHAGPRDLSGASRIPLCLLYPRDQKAVVVDVIRQTVCPAHGAEDVASLIVECMNRWHDAGFADLTRRTSDLGECTFVAVLSRCRWQFASHAVSSTRAPHS